MFRRRRRGAAAGVDPGEGAILIYPYAYDSIQGGWLFNTFTDQHCRTFYSNADQDFLTFNTFLAQGTYRLDVLSVKWQNSGITDIDIDGVEVGSYDGYAAALQANVLFSFSGISVATTGIKTIKVRNDGKNPSSGFYQAHISCMRFVRTDTASTPDASPGDGRIVIHPEAYSSITQGTFTVGGNSVMPELLDWRNTTAAQNDEIAYKCSLAKGTYDLSLYCMNHSQAGIIDFIVDGASIGTIDLYSASPTRTLRSITGWSVASSGLKTLTMIVSTKNVSSTGYFMFYNSLNITPVTNTETDSADPGDGHVNINPVEYDSIGAGTWGFVTDTSQLTNANWENTSNADGDNITYTRWLAAGTYTLVVHAKQDTDHGIMDVDFDGVEKASYDQYASVVTRNVRFETTGIAVGASGLVSIRIRSDGAHASSSGNVIAFTRFTLFRTA